MKSCYATLHESPLKNEHKRCKYAPQVGKVERPPLNFTIRKKYISQISLNLFKRWLTLLNHKTNQILPRDPNE